MFTGSGLPESGAAVDDMVNWYVEACLCLRSGVRGKKATVLFRGQIGEAIHMAQGRPNDERARLFIACDLDSGKLTWPKIEKLAARADFPVIV